MKKKIIVAVLSIVTIIGMTGCASIDRDLKSLSSDIAGGIDRTVTVYDYNGNVIQSWSGKFDVSSSETEVYFDDEDGKRVIIHGGIVINEEN